MFIYFCILPMHWIKPRVSKNTSGRVTCSAVTVNNLDLSPFLIAHALVMSNGEEMFVSLSFCEHFCKFGVCA